MARVVLEIGGNSWAVNCRDGEESQLRKLGTLLDERWADAQRAAGDAGSFRVMLLIALMLADELVDARAAKPGDPADDAALSGIAERLESLADTLEKNAASA